MQALSPSQAKRKHVEFPRAKISHAVKEVNRRLKEWDQQSMMTVTYQSVPGKLAPYIQKIFEKKGWKIDVQRYPDGSHCWLDFHPPEEKQP